MAVEATNKASSELKQYVGGLPAAEQDLQMLLLLLFPTMCGTPPAHTAF